MGRRLDILQAVETRLQTIQTSNGYQTNLGSRVFYWHDLPHEYGETGAVTFRDVEEELIEVNTWHECCLHLEIEAIAFVDGLVETEKLVSDLRTMLKGDRTWGRLALKTKLIKIAKTLETEGKTAARVVAEVDIVFRVPLFEP
jgi:hypothetical protein